MKNFKLILLIFVAASIIQSCATAYIPNKANSPMFADKGEGKFDAAFGFNGADIQTAYSPIKHLGIILDGNFSTRFGDTDTSAYHRHAYGEIGAGYYSKINKKIVMEVYAGYGRGTSDTEWFIENWTMISNVDIKTNFNKYFIQPAIGIVKENKTVSFSSRFSMITMDIDRTESQYVNVNDIDLFWEPAITFASGRNVKFITQIGASVPLIPLPQYSYDPKYFMFSTGIQVHIGRNKNVKSVENEEIEE